MSNAIDTALHDALCRLVEVHGGEDLTAALADFGWPDALAGDAQTSTTALFVAMGRTGAWCSALHDVMSAPELTGGSDTIVALPVPNRRDVDHHRTDHLHGLVVGRALPADVHFTITRADGPSVVVVPADALTSRPIGGLDQRLELVHVSAARSAARPVLHGDDARAAWAVSVDAGRRALAHHLIGASQRMLTLAIEHALARQQFGSVIGSFQAVRHRLADAHVAVEAASAAAAAAWEAEDPSLAAMLAKSLAGRAATITGRHCQQVLAGIGFTAEHPFHHFFLRSVVVDRILGSAAELPEAIGRHLIRGGRVPRLVEL
ncbi:MAG TPA: acyl-CoA dehydrogenase family protein [Mycobacteriales bacterium]|nr:acyl-CoA dehydrogenase family protein [Mycobacteriales bacterium]